MLSTNPFRNHKSSSRRRGNKVGRRQARRSPAGRSTFRRFEPLEDRALLATLFTVTNLDDSGEGSLRDAIENANMEAGPDVIEFAPDVEGTINLTNGELQITDDLTIYGPGDHLLTVSGSGQSRVFSLMESTVEIDHLTIADGLVNGNAATGGGVLVDGNSALTLRHVTVADNHVNGNQTEQATGRGGGVYVARGSTLDVMHGTFRGNLATANRHGGGGAISNAGTITIDLTTFTGNQARTNTLEESGGFDSYCNNAETTGGCSINGGAIDNSSSFAAATVTHSRFVGNEVIGSATIPERSLNAGGAINSGFANTATLDKTYFMKNSVSSTHLANGGAVHHAFAIFAGTGTTITDSTFVGNSVTADVTASGGAIHFALGLGGQYAVEGSRFIRNTASSGVRARGGAISHEASGTANIVGSQFVGNSAHSDGLEFQGGASGAAGGGIASWSGATTIVDRSSIVNNQVHSLADGVAQGGGIFNDEESSCTLTRSNVNANRAIGDPDDGIGGGIYNAEGGSFEIDRWSNVRGNKASTSHDDVFGDLTVLAELLAASTLL